MKSSHSCKFNKKKTLLRFPHLLLLMSFCSQAPFYIKWSSYSALLFRHFTMASFIKFCNFSIRLNSTTTKKWHSKFNVCTPTLLFTQETKYMNEKDRKFPEIYILVVEPIAAEWSSCYLHISPLVYNLCGILVLPLQKMMVTYLANLLFFLFMKCES
jgi:hypothetical protein